MGRSFSLLPSNDFLTLLSSVPPVIQRPADEHCLAGHPYKTLTLNCLEPEASEAVSVTIMQAPAVWQAVPMKALWLSSSGG
jgi:hypothetical protein